MPLMLAGSCRTSELAHFMSSSCKRANSRMEMIPPLFQALFRKFRPGDTLSYVRSGLALQHIGVLLGIRW